MKKFRFRILCAILSVVTCLSLFTACGGGNNGGKLNDLDLRFDENGDPIFNDITLNVWSVIGLPDNVYLNRVADSFNDYYKNNGVKVVVRSMKTLRQRPGADTVFLYEIKFQSLRNRQHR